MGGLLNLRSSKEDKGYLGNLEAADRVAVMRIKGKKSVKPYHVPYETELSLHKLTVRFFFSLRPRNFPWFFTPELIDS